MAEPRVSERFCAADADLTISSSDGVLFKVYRKNLEAHSDIFADASSVTKLENGDDTVRLSESADVLDLLFQYMNRQLPPDLAPVNFSICSALAEAAEKYVVYSALRPCRTRMNESIRDHPLEVLDYAMKHRHFDIANEATRESMGATIESAMSALEPEVSKKWIIFHQNWHREISRYLAKMLSWHTAPDKDVCETLKICLPHPNCYTLRREITKIKADWVYQRCIVDGMKKLNFVDSAE
ncbi:hypothetical protein C8R43DRAFT_986592 [Mycena crocata]|nr:hypothetical protein C8R43DRAFT_986592 [Mycena crocata]